MKTILPTAVTGYVDLSHWELDDYSYGLVSLGVCTTIFMKLIQEVRLASRMAAR